jgi:hypothetical protein
MPPPTPAPVRPLPVWAVARRSFVFAWESRDVLLLPYLVYVAFSAGIDAALLYSDFGSGFAALLIALAEQLLAMAFAVGIHRYVLLGERRPGLRFFRFDADLGRYVVTMGLIFAVAIGLYLVTVFGVGLVSAALGIYDPVTHVPTSPRMFNAVRLFAMLALLAAAIVLLRVSLALPAAALGHPNRLLLAWHSARGNGLRLFATAFLVLLPFLLIWAQLLGPSFVQTVEAIQSGDQQATITAPAATVQIAWDLISPIGMITMTIMLALSFDFLLRGGGPVTERPGTEPAGSATL